MKKFLILTILSLSVCFCSCLSKKPPELIRSNEISYDGNDKTSGVLYQIENEGFIISKQLKDTYDTYLKKYHEIIQKDNDNMRGCREVFIVTDEVMEDLLKMHVLHKNPKETAELKAAQKKAKR